jgi:predicted nucleotide-binding protein (sugar kinase/HSP70/actin superfamily)
MDLMKGYSRMKLMGRLKRKMEAPFDELLADRPVSGPQEIMDAAAPYMKENIGGEAILCVGAPTALSRMRSIDGAVNIFPFTCLPGTVVTAISKKIRKEHRDLPWLNLAFDGQEDTDNEARLQAFMYQVRENFRMRQGMGESTGGSAKERCGKNER